MRNRRPMPADVEVVSDEVADILRRKSGAEKIRMVAGGWPLLRAMHALPGPPRTPRLG